MISKIFDRAVCLWMHHGRIRWVKLYRFLFQAKWRAPSYKLPERTPAELQIFFRRCAWRPDNWKQAMDMIDWPAKFYDTKRGDCDEFAFFALWTLADTGITEVHMLTLIIRPLKRSHAVCVYKQQDLWWHIGNWFKGEPQGPYQTLDAVIDSIIGLNGRLVCATLRNKELEEVQKVKPCFGGCS